MPYRVHLDSQAILCDFERQKSSKSARFGDIIFEGIFGLVQYTQKHSCTDAGAAHPRRPHRVRELPHLVFGLA